MNMTGTRTTSYKQVLNGHVLADIYYLNLHKLLDYNILDYLFFNHYGYL